MDKLLTEHEGGIGDFFDNDRFEEEAYRKALESIAEAIIGGKTLGDACRLHGAVVTDDGTDIDVTAGAIIIGGEVCLVDAQNITIAAGKTYIWDKYIYSNPAEQVPDLEANMFDLYQYRKAKLYEYNDGDAYITGKVKHNELKDFHDFLAINNKLKENRGEWQDNQWIDVTVSFPDDEYDYISVDTDPKYYVDELGYVHWHGSVDMAGNYWNIPAGAHPEKEFACAAGVFVNDSTNVASILELRVLQSKIEVVRPPSASGDKILHLNQIPPYKVKSS